MDSISSHYLQCPASHTIACSWVVIMGAASQPEDADSSRTHVSRGMHVPNTMQIHESFINYRYIISYSC